MSRRQMWVLLAVATLSSTLWGAGAWMHPTQAIYSYLFAFVYGSTIVLGALFLLMIGHASQATWFVPLRRLCERIVGALPVVVLLLVVVLVCLETLYPWTRYSELPDMQAEHVKKKLAWLQEPLFIVRSGLYAASFLVFGELLRSWSLQQDTVPDAMSAARLRGRMVRLSVGGLVFLPFVLTLASWDWIMGLEPTWYSNLYGVYVFAGGFVSALGLLGLASVRARRKGDLPEQVSSHHYLALGRLQLAMVMFWAYIGWCHVLEQWIADLPVEVLWHIRRWHGGWQWEGLVLLLVHFVLPFLVLLFRAVKLSPRAFAFVSLWLVVVHAVDVHYLILPALHRDAYELHWLDGAALVGVVSWIALFCAVRSRGLRNLPLRDPLLERGLAYESQSWV